MLDIRERDDFKRAHFPGAVNIPRDELVARGGIELDRTGARDHRLLAQRDERLPERRKLAHPPEAVSEGVDLLAVKGAGLQTGRP